MPRRSLNRYLLAAALLLACWPAVCAAGELAIHAQGIVDSTGRHLLADRPYDRIISLYGAHTENLFALGAGDRLIGVTRHDDDPPEAAAKPVFSYHDDLEKFLAARPDLVLIRPMIDRGYAQLIRRLEARGIVVVSLQPATVEEMFIYWRILGRLAGRGAEAGRMVARFEEAVAEMRRRTASVGVKKRVYFEAIHDRMRTFAPTAMPIFALETAGGINVAADARPRRGTNIADYGKERILSHAREIDVYLAQYGPMNRPTREMLKSEPGYHAIRAIEEDRIYFIDEELVSRPTLRMLEGICRIGEILYPRAFAPAPAVPGCTGQTQARGGASQMTATRLEDGTRNKEPNP